MVLDAGFSFAHATPTFDGRVLRKGVRWGLYTFKSTVTHSWKARLVTLAAYKEKS